MAPSSLITSLVLLSLALCSTASTLPPSSPRKSLNFGPVRPSATQHVSIFKTAAPRPLDDQHLSRLESLLSFNTLATASLSPLQSDSESIKQFGIELANRFFHHLHSPTTTFELTSAHLSKHTQVLHVYFMQTLSTGSTQTKIYNAVANANVDLDPNSVRFGHILSYGDSFHPIDQDHPEPPAVNFLATKAPSARSSSSRCFILRRKFERVMDSLQFNSPSPGQSTQQQVFGLFSLPLDHNIDPSHKTLLTHFSEEELILIAECEVTSENPRSRFTVENPDNAPVDPRVALISFLTVAGDLKTEHHLRSRSLDDLAESIEVVKKSTAEPSPLSSSALHNSPIFELYNVPGALPSSDPATGHPTEPTVAELAWLSVEHRDSADPDVRHLQMVWRFEHRSRDNWYEAYVDATQPGSVPMVVDWVKDFRPTTEVTGTFEEHLALQASITNAGARLRHFSDGRRDHHSVHETEQDLPNLDDGATSERRTATFRVLPWSVNDPTEAKRETIESPSDAIASPLGWHTIPPTLRAGPHKDISQLPQGWSRLVARHGLRAADTRGNNVFAQENWEGLDNWEANYRPNGTEALKFIFHLGWNKTDDSHPHVEPKRYIDAAVTELFYTCNQFHDLTHRYGFDEESGNFQEFNFGRGGKGGDGVIANAQDGSGYNNANFATPPDGRHGRMRMYVWNGAEPWRDGDLEAGIVIHEYSHGVSTRLTGGPANSGCLGWGEAGGMGEGWGDTFATLIRMQKGEPVDYTMGEWASGMKGGIRKYKYSLNSTVNPETYETLDKPGYWGVHAIGEVWAEMLFTVAEALIAKHGFASNLFPPTEKNDAGGFYKIARLSGKRVPKHGNTLFFQLVLDGMKIQPCRPGFFDARDAILEADEILTGGENKCEIWTAFASKGLGPKASLRGSTPWGGGVRKNDFDLPVGVCQP